MEYSPMLLFMLWALTPSDASLTGEAAGVSARVVELPQPLMSVQSFTFNHGKPFLAERDPLTGALDLRTTPVAKGAQDDYLYEEFEESGESVDRKDGVSSQNIISPFTKSKESELHKFLNLPVHYASSGKYPLVSSSYANTKIQGHASNHRTSTSTTAQTPSTVAPSYYTHKTIPTTTTKMTTSTTTTTTTTTTTPPPIYEYEYEYDYSDKPSKGDYEFLGVSSEITTNGTSSGSSADAPRPFTEQTTRNETSTTFSPLPSTQTESNNKEILENENNKFVDKITNKPEKKPETIPNRGTIKYQSSESTEELPYGPIKFQNNNYHSTTTEDYFTSTSTTKPSTKTQIYTSSNVKIVNAFSKPEVTEIPTTTVNVEDNLTDVKLDNADKIPTKNKINLDDTTSKIDIEVKTNLNTNQSNNSTLKESDNNSIFKHQNFGLPSLDLKPPQISQEIPVKSSYDVSVLFADSRPHLGGQPLQSQGTEIKPQELKPPQTNFVTQNPSLGVSEQNPSKPLGIGSPLRPPGIENPLRPPGIENPLRPPSIGNPLRPPNLETPLKPPGIDNSLSIPPFMLRPPLRPPVRPTIHSQDLGTSNLRPQVTHHHQQYQRPQEDPNGSRPIIGQHSHNGRPQESEHLRPPQLFIQHTRPTPPVESHRPQKVDFNNPNLQDNKQKEGHRPLRPLETEDYKKRPQVTHLLSPSRPESFPPRQPEIDNRPFPRPVQGNEEVVWPVSRPHIHKQTKPPYSFFVAKPGDKEQNKKKPTDTENIQGVGSVESVNIGQPSKVQSHYIQVSPGQENPSYSLQTSFSIGVPPPAIGHSEGNSGQVHFPQEDPLKKFPRPQWDFKPPIKQRHPLPNILPQFRPNAKIGHVEPPIQHYVREPLDTLQPPPLPRPEFLRAEEPLVHRRNGQSSHVTTLQMMQTPLRGALRAEDKDEPVFVVYPSNGGEGVVVGTRGPQRPLPPDNLNINDDSFPLENEDYKTRVDTPILKSKPTKSVVKTDFPYPLVKPEPEEEKPKTTTTTTTHTKDYAAFSPTVSSIEKENNAEINVIPYLQDYMPFATKKPQLKEPLWAVGSDTKPISVTLNTKTTTAVPNHKQQETGPTPLDFQAPFQASLTAPNRGWSVVKRTDNEVVPPQQQTTTDIPETTPEQVFDAQNFKPQLFGGFKPILPPDDKPLGD